MKTGLVYILGVMFALLVFSSEQNNERDSFEVETCESFEINYNTDCLIYEISFSFKNSLEKVTSFRLESLNFTDTILKTEENIISSFFILFQKKSLAINHIKKKPVRLILYFTSDNSESHNLL